MAVTDAAQTWHIGITQVNMLAMGGDSEEIFGPMQENDGDPKLTVSLETYIIN